MRLALVTEGMIHRPIDGLMDWQEEHVPQWHVAAVGRDVHEPDWWATFADNLASGATAPFLSIEHEDRLVSPEQGITGSAAVLGRHAGARATGVAAAGR